MDTYLTLYDNVKWVYDNAPYVYPNDPKKTHAYMKQMNHPYNGCAINLLANDQHLVKIRGYLAEKEYSKVAKYADVVTIACSEYLGNNMRDVSHMDKSRATNIGNIAYIYMTHSNVDVRAKCLRLLKS